MKITSMDIHKVRRANISALINMDRKRGAQARFADRAGMNASHLSQIVTGKSNVGFTLARKIETKIELERFTLDIPDSSLSAARTVDPKALAVIIATVNDSLEQVGLGGSNERMAQLCANLYAVYEQSGEIPDIELAVKLEALREG